MIICDVCGVHLESPKKQPLEYVDVTLASDNRKVRLPIYNDCPLEHREIAPGIYRGLKTGYFILDANTGFFRSTTVEERLKFLGLTR